MVRLVLDDVDQVSLLETELIKHKVQYERISAQRMPLKPPYLLVYGVPLDFDRSLKWINENYEHKLEGKF
jgi:hypothetical protein